MEQKRQHDSDSDVGRNSKELENNNSLRQASTGNWMPQLVQLTADRRTPNIASIATDSALKLLSQNNSRSRLIHQLALMNPENLAEIESSGIDVQAANLQAQALLKQQEDILRNTRLLLQQQHLKESSNLSGQDTRVAEQSIPFSHETPGNLDGHIKAESIFKNGTSASSGSDGNEQLEDADEDKMDDDEYFKNFDSDKLDNETFPLRLYRMLYEVEKSGRQDVVSFFSNGHAFVVRKPKVFMKEIMPRYFSTARLASFQRQLNLYGFHRIAKGGYRGGYSHKYFKKNKRALCRKVKRQITRVKPAALGQNTGRPQHTSTPTANVQNNDDFSTLLGRFAGTKDHYPSRPNVAGLFTSTSTSYNSNDIDTRWLALQGMVDVPNFGSRSELAPPAGLASSASGQLCNFLPLTYSSLEMQQALARFQHRVEQHLPQHDNMSGRPYPSSNSRSGLL